MGLSTTYTKVETDYLLQQIDKRVVSLIKGTATQTNAPTPYTAETYPNGLFERYVVSAPLTSPNSWGNTAVTQAELDDNFVYFNVTNGVVVKELSLKPNRSSFLVEDSVLLNPDFTDGFNNWTKNSAFTTTINEDVLIIDASSADNPAIYQQRDLKAGDYKLIASIKNNSGIEGRVIFKTSVNNGFRADVDIENNDKFQLIELNINVPVDISNDLIIFGFSQLKQIEVAYFYLVPIENNVFAELTKKYSTISQIDSPINISNRSISVTKVNEDIKIEIPKTEYVLDSKGGYRILAPQTVTVPFQNGVYFSKSSTKYIPVNFDEKGSGENVYLYVCRYDYFSVIRPAKYTIGINYERWSPIYPIFELSNNNSSSNVSSWFPNKSNAVSPFKSTLKPFIQKYFDRTSDVTIVQIGDSISTDLNWTDKRPDANERPPFCTEYNVNSYLEEKLRWKEQKYRRFDYDGVFTETLGGGTSSVKEIDDKWGAVGGAFYYPITKVIDGGTNAGISFGFPANHKRLSLILHSDQLFATETKVVIAEGNGKVEVWNGSSWVEANNYITSFRETSDLIIGAITSFYMDNAQKRLKFRSLSDLSAKTITVQNVGVGRFGYWGIEYSPNDYLFTYICASKGSHGITKLQQFETWMVDSFNPDLVIWQMPILNQGLGVASRGWDSSGFNVQFKNKFDALKAKGYLVLPYILWAARTSEFVDTNGNFLSGLVNGKIVSPFADVANIMSAFSSNDYPIINLFDRITEVAQEKAKLEGGNVYSKALVGSGKNGKTFTIDGIHMNKLGNDLVFNMLEPYFNF